MKNLLILATLLMSFNLLAQDSKPFLSLNHNSNLEYKTYFKINKSLGRAWVEVVAIDDSFDDDTMETEYRAKVEGLSFDNEMSAVVYTNLNGEKSICANFVDNSGRMFRMDKMIKTGDCKVSKTYRTVQVDDGFYIKNIRKIDFTLIVK